MTGIGAVFNFFYISLVSKFPMKQEMNIYWQYFNNHINIQNKVKKQWASEPSLRGH